MKPYTDLVTTNEFTIREFDEYTDQIELMWHRDKEHRVVVATELTDWKIQLDNQLPKSLNEEIEIPMGVWHRAIKGSGKLKLKIKKF